VALLLSPLASSLPDGLEHVAHRLAFLERGTAQAPAPFADYTLPGIRSPVVSTALAAVIGTLVCLGVAWAVARWLAGRAKARRA
jgi:cobalt/nickel transport system permease protein